MAIKIEQQSSTTGKPSLTRVHFILDESGSMNGIRQNTIDGFNEYINGLRNDNTDNKYRVSLTKFEGGNIINLFDYVKLKNVREITANDYIPCGGTNLNDAIGVTMTKMMSKGKNKDQNTLIIVMTDGYENMSQEWTKDTVADLIKKQEKEGWTVTFLGANMDAQTVSKGYGISIDNARSFTTEGMRGTMARAAVATTTYASTAMGGIPVNNVFSEEATGLTESDWMEKDTPGMVLPEDKSNKSRIKTVTKREMYHKSINYGK